MPISPFDTIIAPITGPGPAAVAVVRLSGSDSWRIAKQLFPHGVADPVSRYAYYGSFSSGDDGIFILFEEGHSYTGEATAEMSVHGSRASVRALMEAALRCGARMAEPGEFTQRAFLNGRLDLTQAEAVRDTIEAQTDAQLRLANLHREGALRRELTGLRDQLVGAIAAIEAQVDFSEELEPLDHEALAGELDGVIRSLDSLVSTAEIGRLLRQGLRVAIVGPPNAGKSSLLNRLLGSERAIVTEIPGTTRDYVEEQIELAGLPVVLIDTAGLRETQDAVESIGVQRSRTVAANADLVLYVHDAQVGWTETDAVECAEFARRVLVVANKCDLQAPSFGLPLSARTGEGVAELAHQILGLSGMAGVEGRLLIEARHKPLLEEARISVEDGKATLVSPRPDDLAVVALARAAELLGEVTGETATIDVIERIFRDFCIGK